MLNKAGAGKAHFCKAVLYWFVSRLFILVIIVIQDIEGMHAAGLTTIPDYYFDFRDNKKQDCYGLLSSLIFQLSAESDSLPQR